MERKLSPVLSPVQVLERLQTRLQRRVAALEGVKLDGYTIAIAELRIALDLLQRAQRYLEQGRAGGGR